MGTVKKYLFYAIGEIALVVIGILIALQINNWNERYQEHQEEIYILKSFVANLENDIELLKGHIANTKDRSTKVDSVFTILENPSAYTIEEFLEKQTAVIFDDYFVSNRGTFDEGVSSGKLKYIRNNALREQIFRYYSETSRNRNNDDAMYKMTNDNIIPTMVKEIFSTRQGLNVFGKSGAQLPTLNINDVAKNQSYYQALIYTKGDQYQLVDWSHFLKLANSLKKNIEIELMGIGEKTFF